MTPSSAVIRSARGREVVAAGRRLLEEEGPEALTMRRLAERLGIRAPSLYKHLPDKAALEAAIIATGFEEAAAAFEAAVEGAAEGGGQGAHGGAGGTAGGAGGTTSDGAGTGAGAALPALAAAYRRFALAHPHLYRLMTNGPLPREHLPPGLEDRTAAPVLRAAGSRARARAVWAFAHGMVMLELDHRFPADADLDAAWQAGIAAFQPG
ncbi:MAG TPA: TetR/AcrR family transcriptional regulator [Actinomycetota bacterium]|nr:TetR/AcrR family transcriptional regulator [Actinomycetota bacterium]